MKHLTLIEKVHLLESRLGEKWSHSILEPWKFDSSDAVKVQEAGRKIQRHLGLPPLTFIISYSKRAANEGGHIHLDNNSDVFIEIDESLKHDCEMVLAVLAHEICHKYLHLNNLKLLPELENELLTDAATVYTGLGKLSLNGCEKKRYSTSKAGGIATTTTNTRKVGYLDRNQFAFVFRLVCEMRKVDANAMLEGLTKEAAYAIMNPSITERNCFNKNYFSNEFAVQQVSKAWNDKIGEAQKNVAKLTKDLRIVEEHILPVAAELSREFHFYAKNKLDNLTTVVNQSFNKAEHDYIKNLLALEELRVVEAELASKGIEMKKFSVTLSKFVAYLEGNYPSRLLKNDKHFLFQFECPCCHHKMRIGEQKIARVRCSECNYIFIVNTGLDESVATESKHKEPSKESNVGFWKKIQTLFQRS